jgi:hypothetical protein
MACCGVSRTRMSPPKLSDRLEAWDHSETLPANVLYTVGYVGRDKNSARMNFVRMQEKASE